LEAALDGNVVFTDILPLRQADGSFVLSAAQVATLAGGALADGAHTLRVRAGDATGQTTVQELTFTLDTQAPDLTSLGIATADALLGTDDQAAAAVVQMRGVIEADADLG